MVYSVMTPEEQQAQASSQLVDSVIGSCAWSVLVFFVSLV